MLSDRLKELIAQSGLTTKTISDRSGVPGATISRICSGATPNPQFQTIVDICTAIGCTPDVLLYPDAGEKIGFQHPSQEPLDERMVRQYERMLEEKDRLLHEKTNEIKHKDKWIVAEAVALGIMVLVLLGSTLVDLFAHLF